MKTTKLKGEHIHQMTDEALIQLVLSGQENAYAVLVRRYERLLHFVIQGYLPAHDDRQEVIQDTFLRAFRALPDFRSESKFSTWLSKIARTQALSRLRLRRYEIWDSIDETLRQWETDLMTNEADFEKLESRQMLRTVVRQLTPNDAKAIELFYFYEQSIDEIVALTGWSNTNTRIRLSRARRRLQTALVKAGMQPEYFA